MASFWRTWYLVWTLDMNKLRSSRKLVLTEINSALHSNMYSYSLNSLIHFSVFFCILGKHWYALRFFLDFAYKNYFWKIHRNHHRPEDSDSVSRQRLVPISPTFYISHFQMITGLYGWGLGKKLCPLPRVMKFKNTIKQTHFILTKSAKRI